jgi:hypothetical protein
MLQVMDYDHEDFSPISGQFWRKPFKHLRQGQVEIMLKIAPEVYSFTKS